MKITRRAFLRNVRTAAITLALSRLELGCRREEGTPPARPSEPTPSPRVEGASYRGWEDLYRERWQWDRVVKGTHTRVNCISACAWDLYVKDGIVWREEQAAVYRQTNSEVPDFNPRGCQKGGCYSALQYSPSRIKYPLKRVGDRGSGRWQRISWDQALDEIADATIETCLTDGSECIVYDGGSTNVDFGPDTAAELRLISLLGGTVLDSNGAAVGDAALGAVQTWGMGMVDGTADDWMYSGCILVWCMNPSYTRIPDAHFLWEARYRGARVVVVTPDYNATAVHADLWLNPKVGTDTALALAMAETLVSEKLYREDYVKEQTDLPFLVRADNGRFLRGEDLPGAEAGDALYVWDKKSGRAVRVPGTQGHPDRTLELNGIEPALEGAYEIALRNGRTLRVRPVFELLKERLAKHAPEHAQEITGIDASVIREVARSFAGAKAGLILASFGACKHHHSDLMQRALILLLALTGNQGRKGGGLRVAAWWSLSGFETLASAYEPPLYAKIATRFIQPSAETVESHLTEFMRQRYLYTPALLWLYVHGGLKEVNREGSEEVNQALRLGWMPVYPKPGKDPRILICTGGNPLRRWPVPQVVEKHLWPKLRLIASVNFRMSTTTLKSDIVLPAAAYYEKRGVKYAQSYLPYVVVGDKAVEPLGEAKSEWEIFGLLARRIEEKAIKAGARAHRDPLGNEHDLKTLFRMWTDDGKWSIEAEEKALDAIMANSAPTRGTTWEEARKLGAVPIHESGMYGPVSGICSDVKAGETVSPSQWFVEKKQPWPTLTGRQQFYIDHPWFLRDGEELPVHKAPPRMGGNYPLFLTGGHTRWSVHAIWRDEAHMLQLQRGEPIAYMSKEDALQRGVQDHDWVRVHNDAGSCEIRVKISPAVQPGQVIIYHAWEPYQFPNWQSSQEAVPSPFKPLHLIGDYGQLHYRTGGQAPGYSPRGTAVEVALVPK